MCIRDRAWAPRRIDTRSATEGRGRIALIVDGTTVERELASINWRNALVAELRSPKIFTAGGTIRCYSIDVGLDPA